MWSWLMLLFVAWGSAEKNKHYHVASLCKNHFLQQLYRKIDGAVLRSQNEPNLDCVITFQTETILQRFMLRFDQLQLDCNDHLLIYDGAHPIGNYKADLSCRHTHQSVGHIFTRTNFVTLKYVTDAWGTDANGFHLVITAFKDKTESFCRDFRCAQKDFCISTDLLCDGVNHCGDNTDESTSSLCADQDMSQIFGLNLPVFGVVVGSVGVVLIALSAGLVVCCCRKKPNLNNGQLGLGAIHGTAEEKSALHLSAEGDTSMSVQQPMMLQQQHQQQQQQQQQQFQQQFQQQRQQVASGYMTLPLKSFNQQHSGNLLSPAVGQAQFTEKASSNSLSSITLSSALYSDKAVCLHLIRWCLAK